MVVKWGWPICHLSTQGPNFNRRQIGYVALSDGQLHPISRDINSYATLSLSADGKTLATVQQKVVSNFYPLPGKGSTSADISWLPAEATSSFSIGRPMVACSHPT